ncbi:CehA/McbA family metallohydrolase [Streptomyces sp. NPDC004752]
MPVPSAQAVASSALRAVSLLTQCGESLPPGLKEKLLAWQAAPPTDPLEIEELLAPLVLLRTTVENDGAIVSEPGGAPARLLQHGWRSYLVSIRNPFGIRAVLASADFSTPPDLPNMLAPGVLGVVSRDPSPKAFLADQPRESVARAVEPLWLQAELAQTTELSGLPLEYTVLSCYARDSGVKSAPLAVVAAETEAVPSLARSATSRALTQMKHVARPYSASIVFDVEASREIIIDVHEPDGRSTVAAVTVTDELGRAYPSKAMRLAPDMIFQEHVYRATGEPIRLPNGRYSVRATRGPEYRPVSAEVEVTDSTSAIPLVLDRWVETVARGYYAGDPHIHAAGCSHYHTPTEGVAPETMIRHIRGEGLAIGSVLTWGPCYYYQKQFFSGDSISPAASLENPPMQAAQGITWEPQPTDVDQLSMLRYDVEISGFPSSHSGHTVLLGLRDQNYPGTAGLEDWPSWNMPIHRWAHEQGAFTGYAHCGVGLAVGTEELPNYVVPAFASIGANELIVDVPHGLADFQAGAQFSPAAELNIWYHLLNVGYRTLMMGETDYPCMYDEGPGVGRTYVQLPQAPSGPRALETWLAGLRTNASYFGDGRSHVFDFAVDGDSVREQRRDAPATVQVSAVVTAWLPENSPTTLTLGGSRYSAPMGWHLERARIDNTQRVLVELVVNGYPVACQEIVADGSEQQLTFDLDVRHSSWVALRILRSVHTQPIFIEVGGRPIRASRRSAQWLADSVDALWEEKQGFIRDAERNDARQAYERARSIYLDRRDECDAD